MFWLGLIEVVVGLLGSFVSGTLEERERGNKGRYWREVFFVVATIGILTITAPESNLGIIGSIVLGVVLSWILFYLGIRTWNWGEKRFWDKI